jgi:hypothetical protein
MMMQITEQYENETLTISDKMYCLKKKQNKIFV